jgi:predicted glycosyltransferase
VKKRIMLFCHDGAGMGHLRRISRIAGELAQFSSPLVVTGLRETEWIVPRNVEYLKLPNWDWIDKHRAEQHERVGGLGLPGAESGKLRSDLIAGISRTFAPDAIMVDYLPFGQRDELRQMLSATEARKYLIHRGVADTSDRWALGADAMEIVSGIYDKILVTIDPKIYRVEQHDCYSRAVQEKTQYVGLVAPEGQWRAGSGIIVCSAGGGRGGEALMDACVGVARAFNSLQFYVVLGPRSRRTPADFECPENCRIVQSDPDLPAVHANAKVIVTTGGYNTMMEAIVGRAPVIVYTCQEGADDERRRFCDLLGKYRPITVLESLGYLGNVITDATKLEDHYAVHSLDVGGAKNVAKVVRSELN